MLQEPLLLRLGYGSEVGLPELRQQMSSVLSEVSFQFHVNLKNRPPKTGAAFINMDSKLMTSFTWTKTFCANQAC